MHVISDYSTKIKNVIKSERHYKMWVVYSRHSFMVRTIYVFCFTTLWFLVIHWNVIFLLLPLALLREGCDVSWDIHTAAWDTVVCFNWPQWHWATVPTGATACTSIPSLLSPHCPNSSGTGLFHLDYSKKHFTMNRRSFSADLFGTVDTTSIISFTQRLLLICRAKENSKQNKTPVTENLTVEEEEEKKVG